MPEQYINNTPPDRPALALAPDPGTGREISPPERRISVHGLSHFIRVRCSHSLQGPALRGALVLTLFIASVGAATESIESNIWINNLSWELAFNSGDMEALVNLYTKDAVVVPPSLEILTAQEEITKFWANQILTGTDNFRLQTINLRLHGDVIYQTAVWVATKTSNGVATDLDGEMTNVITRQEDGSWKIQLQSWN